MKCPMQQVSGETMLHSGHWFKERNDGRIDVTLPWAAPYNETALVLNPFVAPLVRALLGADVDPKAAHASASTRVREILHACEISEPHWVTLAEGR